MLHRQGFTLMEMLVVFFIIALVVGFSFPSFMLPTEMAQALNARNNLLAIYSAQMNYFNNNNSVNYCLSATNSASPACVTVGPSDNTCADNLTQINCNLSLYIQDTLYSYACGRVGITPNVCTATRINGPAAFSIAVNLNLPIQLNGGVNPSCTPSTSNWCP